jgi:hypothetical protein
MWGVVFTACVVFLFFSSTQIKEQIKMSIFFSAEAWQKIGVYIVLDIRMALGNWSHTL